MVLKKKYRGYIRMTQFVVVGVFVVWYGLYIQKHPDQENAALLIGVPIASALAILIILVIVKIGKRDLPG